MAAFGLVAAADAVHDARSVARLVAAAAAQEGDLFARRICGAYVVAEPRFRLGLITRSLTSVVRPGDWERLVLERYDELPRWREREFARWLNDLVASRMGFHRPPRRSRGPASGEDATAAALVATIRADG